MSDKSDTIGYSGSGIIGSLALIVFGLLLTFAVPFIGVLIVICGILWVFAECISYNYSKIEILESSVIIKSVFSIMPDTEVCFADISDVKYDRLILGKIFDTGILYIKANGKRITFGRVDRPDDVCSTIKDISSSWVYKPKYVQTPKQQKSNNKINKTSTQATKTEKQSESTQTPKQQKSNEIIYKPSTQTTKTERYSESIQTPTYDYAKIIGDEGEDKVVEILNSGKISGNYKILRDLYIPCGMYKYSQIDAVMIHENGVYVFESKNHNGRIYSRGEYSTHWIEYYSDDFHETFQNPILQNKNHIKNLKSYLNSNGLHCVSVIAFGDGCQLNYTSNHNNEGCIVDNYRNLSKVLNENIDESSAILEQHEIDDIYERLRKTTDVSEKVKQRHIEYCKRIEERYNH